MEQHIVGWGLNGRLVLGVTISATSEVENVLTDEGAKQFQFTQRQFVTFFHCLLSVTRVVAILAHIAMI